jgi:hypothetical protein
VARRLFVLAMLLTACAVGVFGYQIGYYWIIGNWPAVPVRVVWEGLFTMGAGDIATRFGRVAAWVGSIPVSAALLAMAYLAYLTSDQLRLR